MKSLLKWIVIIALFGGGAGFLVKRYADANVAQAYELELNAQKTDFLRRSVGLRLLGTEAYRAEVGEALTSYFNKINDLSKKFPGHMDVDREAKRLDNDLKNGRVKDDQKLQREERIAIAKDLYERMRTGQYRPLYTAADKTFRFDIYDIGPAKVNGEDRIKLSFVHWGAFGDVSYNLIEGNIRAPVTPGSVAIPKIVGSGQPPSLQLEPDRWVKELIPGLSVGYYDLPMFPREATAVQLVFDFGVRTQGGSDIPVHLDFGDIAIPDSWKLPEGKKWEAEVQTASDEELEAAGVKAAQK